MTGRNGHAMVAPLLAITLPDLPQTHSVDLAAVQGCECRFPVESY